MLHTRGASQATTVWGGSPSGIVKYVKYGTYVPPMPYVAILFCAGVLMAFSQAVVRAIAGLGSLEQQEQRALRERTAQVHPTALPPHANDSADAAACNGAAAAAYAPVPLGLHDGEC